MLVASPILRFRMQPAAEGLVQWLITSSLSSWTDHSHDSAGSSVPRRRHIPRIGPNNNDLGDVAGNGRTRLGDSTRCDYSHELRHGVRRLRVVSGATDPILTATR